MSYSVNNNGREEKQEINLLPQREIKKLGFDFTDVIIFCILMAPLLIIAFVVGWDLIMGLIFAAYACVCAIFCFINSRSKGKLRVRFHRWIAKQIFGKKNWNEQEIKAFYRFKNLEDNNLFYKNEERDGVISIYRISGYDLSLSESAIKNQIIDDLSQFWGHRSDFDIISCGIQYQIEDKTYKLKKSNELIKHLQTQYSEFINQMSKDLTNKECAYFLVLNGNSVEENQERFEVLNRLIRESKITLSKANTGEISQICNQLWPEASFDVKNAANSNSKHIKAYKNFLKIYHKDGTYELMGFKMINCLPDIATTGYLCNIFNDTNYTLYTSTKYLDGATANGILRNLQSSISRIISGKWFEKRATDLQRIQIKKVEEEITMISEQIARESHIYELRELCMYVIFKGTTRKELNTKMDLFDKKLYDYEKNFVINNLDYFQIDAFINTRMYELPSLQFRKSAWESFKNAFRSRRTSARTLPMEIIRDNAFHVLNSSLAIGFPFSNSISIGGEDTWYKGKMIDYSGMNKVSKPIFENYWKVNESYHSFTRIYLAHMGGGKTWAAKRDIINDYFDNNYVLIIDPKRDYGKMVEQLSGHNFLLGKKQVNTKSGKYLNIWDVLNVAINVDENGEEIILSPLEKTYIKNDAVITALLNLSGRPDEEELMAAWRKVQKFVYENPNGKCKFTTQTDFIKTSKSRMPIMEDFYKCALSMSKNKNDIIYTSISKLATLLEQYNKDSTYGYLFNTYSNVDWNDNQLFNLDISAIANTRENIFGAWIIYLMQVALEIMFMNKYTKRRFVLYLDEFHRVRHIQGVLSAINTFVRLSRSHNGATCVIDQGLGVVSGEANRLYKEIFELTQYSFFFNSSENDINKIEEMISNSGRPLSQVEHRFIARAKQGECLMVCSAWERYRLSNDVSYWMDFFKSTRSEATT